ncbi:unnamed protein product [Scytosiphon promiscuus]
MNGPRLVSTLGLHSGRMASACSDDTAGFSCSAKGGLWVPYNGFVLCCATEDCGGSTDKQSTTHVNNYCETTDTVPCIIQGYPDCGTGIHYYIGDGYCDSTLNTEVCGWDNGDCCKDSCCDGQDYTCKTNGYDCQDPDPQECSAATTPAPISPALATAAPAVTTFAPNAATVAPVLATKTPSTVEPTQTPVSGTSAPVVVSAAPTAVDLTQTPVSGTSTPVVVSAAPTAVDLTQTPLPGTSAPVLASAAPTTVDSTPAPTGPASVQVDLVPCILANETVAQDVSDVASAYLLSEYFKGFWTATQIVETEISATDLLDLAMDDDDNHGKCNVVFVGIVLSDDQKLELQDYSRKFKVRIVYFNIADTILDTEVQTRLGMQSLFDQDDGTDDWVGDWTINGASRVKLAGGEADSVVPSDLETDPTINTIYNRPVEQVTALPTGVSILANYASEDGTILLGTTTAFEGAQSVAIAEYIGTDGLEEMHVFINLAWFDVGSWAWAHFIAEWGTKGIFQGERRFYLGAVDDDLFLSTGQWEYLPDDDYFGEEVRLTGVDLAKFQEAEEGFGNVRTEHAFNGLGILDKVYADVDSPWRSWDDGDADIALLVKGEKPQEGGITQVTDLDWLSTTFNPADGEAGMADDIDAGNFTVDDLLVHVQENLDAFYWQSHTFSHLARDDLGVNDCLAEDAGNVQMAILLGFYDSDNYNWRSMTSPGITGLFNEYCLQSGADNLMTCYPGDNTYTLANTNPETVSLINEDNQFHSLTTTVDTNGLAGMQIIPRFSTNVYYNCVTGQCLVDENEKIRRDVCECEELDPSLDKGECSNADCTIDGVTNIQSFNNFAELADESDPKPLQALFETEERDTTRYILSGRRDKYMFHQANLISTNWTEDTTDPLYVDPRPENDPSLLEYWYIRVLAELGTYLNTETFSIETLKFDNLCHNFYQHEYLDNSGAVLTATKDSTGAITGMTLATTSENGAPIPLTVPTADADSVSLGSLIPSETETYGADTTYRFAAGTLDAGDLDKPDLDDLYQIPKAQAATNETESAQAETDAELAEEEPLLLAIAETAAEEATEVANNQGFVAEGMND